MLHTYLIAHPCSPTNYLWKRTSRLKEAAEIGIDRFSSSLPSPPPSQIQPAACMHVLGIFYTVSTRCLLGPLGIERTNASAARVQERNDLSRQVAEGLAALGGDWLGRSIRKAPLHVGTLSAVGTAFIIHQQQHFCGAPIYTIRLFFKLINQAPDLSLSIEYVKVSMS